MADHHPVHAHLLIEKADDLPGLICHWTFKEGGEAFTAELGEPYTLRSGTGPLEVRKDEGSQVPHLHLKEGQWLSVPRSECPGLDVHGRHDHLTLLARVRRRPVRFDQCEFIAGQWNETNLGRQYGMFINISVWGVKDRLFGHLSQTGGPTPGYRYCMDGPQGEMSIPRGEWLSLAMSYDGSQGFAWTNGLLDGPSALNPYSLAGGLHDSGEQGSDFTVGAVHRSGEMGNFFHGDISALAVYDRALSPAEIYAWHHLNNL